jgi:energy-coupling factor transport system substrate-specific component
MPQVQALCDEIVEDLRALREAAGSPSFGELVVRISRQRVDRGMSPAQARVGRTTVYDVFRTGRRFLDPDLVGEVVTALGVSPDEVTIWVARAHRARNGVSFEAPVAAPVELTEGKTRRPELPTNLMLWVLLGCLVLNLLGRTAVNFLHIPLYLDMVGTAVAAIVIGPWRGAAVGVLTSVLGAPIDVWANHVLHGSLPHWWLSIPFGLVEIVGALMWGYGVRRWRMGRTISRFFLLNVGVALVCSLVAVPIIVVISHGFTGNGADAITFGFMKTVHDIWSAVFFQNLETSLADKMISGFVALAAAEAIPSSFDEGRERLKITSAWLLGVSWFRGRVRA